MHQLQVPGIKVTITILRAVSPSHQGDGAAGLWEPSYMLTCSKRDEREEEGKRKSRSRRIGGGGRSQGVGWGCAQACMPHKNVQCIKFLLVAFMFSDINAIINYILTNSTK